MCYIFVSTVTFSGRRYLFSHFVLDVNLCPLAGGTKHSPQGDLTVWIKLLFRVSASQVFFDATWLHFRPTDRDLHC